MLPSSAPNLSAPSGDVVTVSTVSQLMTAVGNIVSGRTIVLNPGTYNLTDAAGGSLYFNAALSNIALRGATNNYDDVVIAGIGMSTITSNTNFGVWLGGGVNSILIANLTIKDVYYSPIQMNANSTGLHLYHCRLLDAGQQHIKSTQGGGNNDGIVEFCALEYTTYSRTLADPYNGYINAVDDKGDSWIIRDNLFKNIRSNGALGGPAVLCWQGCTNAIVERNTFINCARDISMGLVVQTGFNDNVGGIVRNNFIYRDSGQSNMDVPIYIADSPSTKVYNNSIIKNGTYANAIEYRFATTTGVIIRNNLVDGAIQLRDGASGTVSNNVTNATSALFVSPSTGDMHLQAAAATAIDQGVTLATDVLDDWDGIARPIGSAYDMGADEFAAADLFAVAYGHSSGIVALGAPLSPPLTIETDSVIVTDTVAATLSPLLTSLISTVHVTDSVTASVPSGGSNLLQSGDMAYLGFFTVPAGSGAGFSYGGTGLAIGLDGTSIYYSGDVNSEVIGRVSIPSLGGTASVITNPTSVPGNTGGQNATRVAGALAYNGRLLVLKANHYNDGAANPITVASNAAALTGFTGTMYGMSGVAGQFVSGYLGLIPPEWQTAFGGPAFIGCSSMDIISACSGGPSFYVFDPDVVGVSTITGTCCMAFDYGSGGSHWIANSDNANNTWSRADYDYGVIFPDNTRTLLWIHRHGYGTPTYKVDDGCGGDAGEGSAPYRRQVDAFDINDLLAVKAGSMQPYAVRPYAWWTLPGPADSCARMGGYTNALGVCAWDPATRRMYATLTQGDTRQVHVWSIGTP